MLVGCLNMSVRADDSGDLSVEKTSHGNPLARRFAVHIHDDIPRLFAHFYHRCFRGSKRVFENRLHKRARLHVQHPDLSLGRLQNN